MQDNDSSVVQCEGPVASGNAHLLSDKTVSFFVFNVNVSYISTDDPTM